MDSLPPGSADKLPQALVIVVLARDIFQHVVQDPWALGEGTILEGRGFAWEKIRLEGESFFASSFSFHLPYPFRRTKTRKREKPN